MCHVHFQHWHYPKRLRKLFAGCRIVSERDSLIKSLKNEIIDLKEQIATREHKLSNISYDLVNVMGKADDRVRGKKSARQVALDKFYKKYSKSEAPVREEGCESELKHHLHQVESVKQAISENAEKREKKYKNMMQEKLHENTQLIKEISDMRRQNKELQMELANVSQLFTGLKLQGGTSLGEQLDNLLKSNPVESTRVENTLNGNMSLARGPITRPTSSTRHQPGSASCHTSKKSRSFGFQATRARTPGPRRPSSADARPQIMYGVFNWRKSAESEYSREGEGTPTLMNQPSHEEIQQIATQLAANAKVMEHQSQQLANLQALLTEESEVDGIYGEQTSREDTVIDLTSALSASRISSTGMGSQFPHKTRPASARHTISDRDKSLPGHHRPASAQPRSTTTTVSGTAPQTLKSSSLAWSSTQKPT